MATTFDYAPLALKATELITRFGKDVTLTRAARSSGLDVWETDQGPVAAAAAQSFTMKAVRTALDKETLALQAVEGRLGVYVTEALSTLPEDIGNDWQLVDGTATYTAMKVRPVQPGGTLLVYFITVRL